VDFNIHMFNRHKLRRKISRTKRQYSHNTAITYGAKRKDFAWSGKKGNPLTQEASFFSRKRIIELILLGISTVSLAWVLMFHPFFHITDITIEGMQRLTQREILETVQGTLSYKKFFVFPARNYFFVGTEEMEEVLKHRYPLNTVQISKQFPNSLHVSLQERLSTIIYDDGNMYYFMGLTGKIVEPIQKVTSAEWNIRTEVVTSTSDMGELITEEKEVERTHIPDVNALTHDIGEYPIVFSGIPLEDAFDINTEVLPEAYVRDLVEWYEMLQQQSDIQPTYVDMSNVHDTIFFTTGMDIHIDITGESAIQIDRLHTALQEISNTDSLSYIDVRYAGRVYWK